jgi:hypothetical protein
MTRKLWGQSIVLPSWVSKELNELEAQGFTIFSITPITDGKPNYQDVLIIWYKQELVTEQLTTPGWEGESG